MLLFSSSPIALLLVRVIAFISSIYQSLINLAYSFSLNNSSHGASKMLYIYYILIAVILLVANMLTAWSSARECNLAFTNRTTNGKFISYVIVDCVQTPSSEQ